MKIEFHGFWNQNFVWCNICDENSSFVFYLFESWTHQTEYSKFLRGSTIGKYLFILLNDETTWVRFMWKYELHRSFEKYVGYHNFSDVEYVNDHLAFRYVVLVQASKWNYLKSLKNWSFEAELKKTNHACPTECWFRILTSLENDHNFDNT